MINSSITHELRNPLSVIINQSLIIKRLCREFYECIDPIKAQCDQYAFQKLTDFHNVIEAASETCHSSSEQLRFNVEDLLSFSQL